MVTETKANSGRPGLNQYCTVPAYRRRNSALAGLGGVLVLDDVLQMMAPHRGVAPHPHGLRRRIVRAVRLCAGQKMVTGVGFEPTTFGL